MEYMYGLYGRLFRSFIAVSWGCALVKILSEADFLPNEINLFKLMFVTALAFCLFVQFLDGVSAIDFVVIPAFCVGIVGIIGMVVSFGIPIANDWMFDQEWSFDIEGSLKFWSGIGGVLGLIIFVVKSFYVRARSRKWAVARQALRSEQSGSQSSLKEPIPMPQNKGFLRKIADNPFLTVLASVSSIIGLVYTLWP